MSVPLRQQLSIGSYILKQKLTGNARYPLVLMLEPLFRCNLACAGCGKIDYPEEILNRRLSVEECLKAVDECGAPVVSIPGGEPLLHKEMPEIVAQIVARRKFVYLCTNALLLTKRIKDYTPSPYFTFSIHLDGNRERHDASVCQEGVFDRAVAAIKLARDRGFRVTVNCTLFQGEDPQEVAEFFDFASGLGVEGITMSPDTVTSARRVRTCSCTDARARSCSVTSSASANRARHAGPSTSPACFWTSWRAIRPTTARRGATRRATCSAGSARAICW